MSGNLVIAGTGQIIRFVLALVLIRFLSPLDFASYSVIIASISILSFVLDFGFTTKILSIKDVQSATRLIATLFQASLFVQAIGVSIGLFDTELSVIINLSLFSFQIALLAVRFKILKKPILVNTYEHIIRIIPFIISILFIVAFGEYKLYLLSLSASSFFIGIFLLLYYGMTQYPSRIQFDNRNIAIWLSGLLVTLLGVTDIYVIKVYFAAYDLAAYKIHAQFAAMILLALPLSNSVYSGDYITDKRSFKRAKIMARYMSLIIGLVSCIMFTVIIPIIVDAKYEIEPLLFVLLISTYISNTWYGPIGLYANIIGKHKIHIEYLLVAIGLYIVLCSVLLLYRHISIVIIANLLSTLTWNHLLHRTLRRQGFLS